MSTRTGNPVASSVPQSAKREGGRRVDDKNYSADVVTALFRLVKLATLHAIDNQAVVRQVEEAATAVNEYTRRTEHNVSILFAQGSVLVGGQLLRGSRGVYEGALELGELLSKVGASEIGIQRDVKPQELAAFVSAMTGALRSGKSMLGDRSSQRIRLRSFSGSALGRETAIDRIDEHADPGAAIVRAYASAIVIMRRFHDDMKRGRYELPQRVKRVAQRLVDLSAGETPAFLGVTAARNANHDEAGRAVNSAILALSVARQITDDGVTLLRLATAALLYDCAHPRLVGIVGQDVAIVPQLSDAQEAESPMATAAVLLALGRINETNVVCTALDYEAHWVKRERLLGPIYRGVRPPTLQARIIAIARAFNDLLTPATGLAPISADEAIAELERQATEAQERTVLRLLIGALGLFPTGTLVELSTGEVALVVQTAVHPSQYSQPRVRLVFDASGAAVAGQIEIDLAEPTGPGQPLRVITRVVATSDDAASGSLRALASGVRANTKAGAQGGVGSAPPLPASGSRATRSASSSPIALIDDPDSLEEELPQRGATRAVEWQPQVEAPNAKAAPTTLPAPAMTMPAPPLKPTAEGTFARTPMVHLLVYMLDQRLTGTTTFHTSSGEEHAVYFEKGTASKVKTGTMVAPLDRVILSEGLLSQETLQISLRDISKKRILHGRHLVSEGLLDRDTVMKVLRLQLVQKLMFLVELPADTRYAYHQGDNFLASYGGPELTPADALAVIMAGIRLRASDPIVDATLSRLSARPMGLHRDTELKRFELSREEAAVCDLLRARRMTLPNLLESGVGQARVVRMMVYALAITRCLDLGVAGRPPVGCDAPSVDPPPRAAAAPTKPPSPAKPAAPTPPAAPTTPPAPAPAAAVAANVPAKPARTGFGMTFGKPGAKPADASPPPQAVVSAPPPADAFTRTTQRFEAVKGAASPSAIPAGTNHDGAASGPKPRSPSGTSTPSTAPTSDVRSSAPPTPKVPTQRGDTSTSQPPSGPNSRRAAPVDLAARRVEIEVRGKSIDREDFFQMLGIERDAPQEAVQGAYFALAKTWHPDRVPFGLDEHKSVIAHVFARITEAYQTLGDATKRAAYLKSLEQGGGHDEDAKIAQVIDAAMAFQKAEVLLKKHDLPGAEMLARQALQADPDQPEYMTLIVWIQALRRGDPPALKEGVPSPHFDDLIRKLDAVIAKEPRFERALFFRGSLLKRSGRVDRAIKDFRLAAEVNPKNIDAVREVRLYDMRKRGAGGKPNSPSPPPEGGGGGAAGLFGKLFKR